MGKKYYWLQLKEDFFRQKEIKLLRKIAGGDTYTIIYLKMMLMSLKDEGKILYEGVGSDLAEEIALEIDEDVENVQITINYLMSKNLLVTSSEYEGFLSDVPNLIGSESDSAKRVRKHRQIKKDEQKTLQSNTEVTNGNTEIEIEIEIELEKYKKNTSSGLDDLFSEAWALYPKKTMRKEAIAAFKKYMKSEGSDVNTVINGINRYNRYLQENSSWLKPMDGGRWFQKERWADDYELKMPIIEPEKTEEEKLLDELSRKRLEGVEIGSDDDYF